MFKTCSNDHKEICFDVVSFTEECPVCEQKEVQDRLRKTADSSNSLYSDTVCKLINIKEMFNSFYSSWLNHNIESNSEANKKLQEIKDALQEIKNTIESP